MAKRFTQFFVVPLDDDLVIEVEYGFDQGLPMPFVVRLMAELSGRKVCVSRYDSAHLHEPPHRDVLGLNSGNIKKIFYESLDYRDAVKYAIHDYKLHGQDYLKAFLDH
jgi:hypothetical protein